MDQKNKLIEKLLKEEKTLIFDSFNSEIALEIGLKLASKAIKEKLPVAIDIEMNGQTLFHFANEGATPDNAEWIRRKKNVVNRFRASSFRVGRELELNGQSLEETFMINEKEFSAHGGSFPIIIKNTGVIGTITVSGLPQEIDHKMVVEAIREYLKQ